MTALKIPQHVVLNQTVRMECNFNLDRETLYSVKWYKDGHEFYRYVPKEQPAVHVFKLAGVSVDVCIPGAPRPFIFIRLFARSAFLCLLSSYKGKVRSPGKRGIMYLGRYILYAGRIWITARTALPAFPRKLERSEIRLAPAGDSAF